MVLLLLGSLSLWALLRRGSRSPCTACATGRIPFNRSSLPQHSYLRPPLVGMSTPSRKWAREGIGTKLRAW
ncbi:hypothetical protein C8R47DRAFT_1162320 [Mycena vitilis]|nr:hypothetical protein C8R47DRAFT_1162320 [Mycena vitilis]